MENATFGLVGYSLILCLLDTLEEKGAISQKDGKLIFQRAEVLLAEKVKKSRSGLTKDALAMTRELAKSAFEQK